MPNDFEDAFEEAMKVLLETPLPMGDILMGEKTLQSFEGIYPNIREAAELVSKELDDGEVVTYWRLGGKR